MLDANTHRWLYVIVSMLIFLKTDGYYVNITYVKNAVAKGAVCLDGSPPAYHLDRGSGAGINNWLIQLEGGGWCNNITSCLARRNNRLGSSKHMPPQLAFSGLLGHRGLFNPDFYNWNRVTIRYCDGSSFTGDVEAVDPATNLHYRGARVWRAVIEDLLENGMKNAENALLSGCSAGGLASILHCDSFRSLMPMGAKVKCLSDAGYFINVNDVSGQPHIYGYFDDVLNTHGSAKNLPASCTSHMNASMCFFPQYSAPQIKTPIFILNSAYDSWQIKNILAPGVDDPHGTWHDCKNDIKHCSPDQIQTMQGFRAEFLKALAGVGNSAQSGLFINSCYSHCQSEMQEYWLMPDSPVLDKIPIAKAVADWFYDRSPFQKIDCPYPCDSSCHNSIFGPQEQPQEHSEA
ncbi:hypothetical protein QJS10_CPA01g03051 [Acorus calamus]|uniref:Pectin acetylesterase n=1 Tax=Acorus calamus TaxID=4465 RepID=A0AAV9FI99_ACOCL|nr:hypothetical protein QJS10_CPA01g03051 [Acorus calamus]